MVVSKTVTIRQVCLIPDIIGHLLCQNSAEAICLTELCKTESHGPPVR